MGNGRKSDGKGGILILLLNLVILFMVLQITPSINPLTGENRGRYLERGYRSIRFFTNMLVFPYTIILFYWTMLSAQETSRNFSILDFITVKKMTHSGLLRKLF